MNPELITRLVSLVEKTGDRVVLADPTTGKAVVVMDLNSYEKLCVPAQTQVALEITSAPIEHQKPQEIAEISQISKPRMTRPTMPTRSDLADLTHEELMDKINRDIGAWKEAQESRTRAEERPKQPAYAKASEDKPPKQTTVKASVDREDGGRDSKVSVQMEDEERFYLEPIE